MGAITYTDVLIYLIGGAMVYAGRYLPAWWPASSHRKMRRRGSRRRRRSEEHSAQALRPARSKEQAIARTWPELPYLVQVFRDNAITGKAENATETAAIGVLHVSEVFGETAPSPASAR